MRGGKDKPNPAPLPFSSWRLGLDPEGQLLWWKQAIEKRLFNGKSSSAAAQKLVGRKNLPVCVSELLEPAFHA